MERELQLLDKVKLKIEQPQIICAGRRRVRCYYRGIVIGKYKETTTITFKAYNKIVEVMFISNRCITEGWEDLKIVNKRS